jgi:hypothetical protein
MSENFYTGVKPITPEDVKTVSAPSVHSPPSTHHPLPSPPLHLASLSCVHPSPPTVIPALPVRRRRPCALPCDVCVCVCVLCVCVCNSSGGVPLTVCCGGSTDLNTFIARYPYRSSLMRGSRTATKLATAGRVTSTSTAASSSRYILHHTVEQFSSSSSSSPSSSSFFLSLTRRVQGLVVHVRVCACVCASIHGIPFG